MTITTQTKPTKYAVALVVKRADGAFLTTRRPDDDSSLPGVWGLPAVSRDEDEALEAAAVRVGRQKLGVEVKLGRYLGEDSHERHTFVLRLAEFEAEIVAGKPEVPQPDTSVTQYVDFKYSHDPMILVPAAQAGSVCSRIFLDHQGVPWREADEFTPTN